MSMKKKLISYITSVTLAYSSHMYRLICLHTTEFETKQTTIFYSMYTIKNLQLNSISKILLPPLTSIAIETILAFT